MSGVVIVGPPGTVTSGSGRPEGAVGGPSTGGVGIGEPPGGVGVVGSWGEPGAAEPPPESPGSTESPWDCPLTPLDGVTPFSRSRFCKSLMLLESWSSFVFASLRYSRVCRKEASSFRSTLPSASLAASTSPRFCSPRTPMSAIRKNPRHATTSATVLNVESSTYLPARSIFLRRFVTPYRLLEYVRRQS